MKNDYLKKIIESLSLKIFIVILTVLGVVITLFTLRPEQKIELKYEIMSNTNVIDFNADVSKLEIIYDSTNLKEKKKNLRIYTIKIVNAGNKDITNEVYDVNDPIGIKINSGEIIEKPELIQTSSDYLKNNLKITDYTKNKLTFKSVILDQKEYFVIKLLILHKKDVIPNIISIGKISGQKNIQVVNSSEVKEETNFWVRTFGGNIYSQILRFVASTLVFILIILGVFGISEISIFNNRKKKRLVKQFKKLNTYNYTRKDDPIFERYIHGDYLDLNKMDKLINDEKLINEIYWKSLKIKIKKFRGFEGYGRNHRYRPYFNYNASFEYVSELIKDGIIIKEQDKLVYNISLKETTQKFIHFLKEKEEIKRVNSEKKKENK